MKYTYRIIFTFFLCIVFSTCSEEKEVYKRGYPKVETMAIENINGSLPDFTAEVFNFEKTPIIEYGFLWSENNKKLLDEAEQQKLGNSFTDGKFSATVNASFKRKATYYVRAYIKTENYTVYGNQKSFDSE